MSPYRRRRSQLAPTPRAARGTAGEAPAPTAWRWAAITLAALSTMLAAHAAAGQTTPRPPRPTVPRTGTRPSHTAGAALQADDSSPAGGARADGAPTARTPTDSGRAPGTPVVGTRARSDSVPSDSTLASTNPAAPPAPPALPAAVLAPNVPGAPNVAGRLSAPLDRAELLAPLVETVSGGTGPAVLHVQVLLDAARFSPGAVSGVWNENTVFAIRAFRGAVRLPPGDSADADVVARLERVAGVRPAVTEYVVTAADVRGPYRRTPSSVYAQAKVDCLCYQSMSEMLGERFHTTAEVLRQLNPSVDVARAAAGTHLVVPNVDRGAAPAVARIVVDKREGSIRGVDARGVTRFWLPATVGSPSLPSPVGRLRVVSATLNPRYQYDPVVLGEARGARPNALLAPGPNSPVGVLWAQLSRPHVGLHGTPYPEEVGYTMSHGCVRMANWDARWLTPRLQPGLIVDFL